MGDKDFDDYLVSDCWKCDKSPTNAHHWRRLDQTEQLFREGWFMCQCCGDTKRMIVEFAGSDKLIASLLHQ